MATFYGQVEGNSETRATRLGSFKSGIEASVQSYHGSVTMELYYENDTGKGQDLCIRVWYGEGSKWEGDVIYNGPLSEFHDKLAVRLHL